MDPVIEIDLQEIVSADYVDWRRFAGKRVLVTGANGMLPSYLVFTLLWLNRHKGLDVTVYALARNAVKLEACFRDWLPDGRLRFLVQDVCDPVILDGPLDYIIHAASQASPRFYGVDPVGTLKANVLGTYHLLELARQKNVCGFLFLSSSTVYGALEGPEPFVETRFGGIDPLNVRNCYSESKRLGENLCACYAWQYGVKAKIVRIFHTFGPKVQPDDGRVFSDFCWAVARRQDIVLKSDGRATRPFCYVADAVKAYFKVLLDGEVALAYNVGGDAAHEISMAGLAFLLTGLYPERKLHVVFDIDENSLAYSKMRTPQVAQPVDLGRISALGWSQTLSLEESFRRTIDSLDNHVNQRI